ncbi:MAG: TCR/Tet family MFS transporter [Acidobacteria bacterium]|nr:TCR/Tet family MFS transporter [Acidobacteriota bacterium]
MTTARSSGTRQAAVAFIFITILLDMLALGMIIPVLPVLIEEFRGGDTASAARTVGLFGTVWAGIQFFAAPVLGALSDRYGRRPTILLSNLGLGADYLLMALAPSLGWLFVGRVLSGITSASVPTAFAYLADVTPVERRAHAYGVMGAAFGIGFIVGPALGGVLSVFGPRTPFWVAGAFSLANAAYGYFVLPESLDAAHRRPFSWARANPIGSLRLLRSHHTLVGFAAIHFLYHLAHQSLQGVFVLYTDYRYGWTSTTVGWALAGVGVCSAIVQAGLVGRVVSAIGERPAVLFGLSAGVVGFAIYGLAPTGAAFVAGIPIMSLWGFYGPAAQGLMTRRVGRSEQGALQGALASIQMVTGLIGPALFAETFAASISGRGWNLPGMPFLLASALLVASVFVAIAATRRTAAAA